MFFGNNIQTNFELTYGFDLMQTRVRHRVLKRTEARRQELELLLAGGKFLLRIRQVV